MADDDHSPATGDSLVKTHHRFFHCQIDGSKGKFYSGRSKGTDRETSSKALPSSMSGA